MSPYSPLFAFVIYLIAYLSARILRSKEAHTTDLKRNETIDGLRGMLAIAVFGHHAHIWFIYLQTAQWQGPESIFFMQLGHIGISLFFMISSFLFVHWILELKSNQISWWRFFKRRFLRLAPLHFVVTLLLVGIVMFETNWTLQVNFFDFLMQVSNWIGFGIVNLNPINGYDANLINAGVLWSLSYEWLLYFLIPLVAMVVLKPKKETLLFSLIGVFFIILTVNFRHYQTTHLFSFLGGAIAAVFYKFNKTAIDFTHFGVSIFILLLFMYLFHSQSTIVYSYKLLLTGVFVMIALGNDFFGLFKNKTIQFLGTISYGTYLLHGLILFVVFNYVLGFSVVLGLSPFSYCLLIFCLTPLVVVLSFLGYKYVEKPFLVRKSQ